MKKIFYFLAILVLIVFITSVNIFLKIKSDFNHIIGIDINLFLYLIITIICLFTVNRHFKKANLDQSKTYKKDMKTVFANSFFVSSIISIVSALIIYGFLEKFLNFLNLKQGLINYTTFSMKIWFISSPFIGLEVTVFRYFKEINYFKIPIKLLIFKLIIFYIISALFFIDKKVNCFIYAKPICDMIFLLYYTKVCFDATLKI